MSDDDKKVSERYRELPREEPPRALDDAILAASRRAVQARPAPLVAPTGRRRWYVPLAAAAVITLAVAVTLHVERDRPGEEVDAVSPAMKVQEAPKAEVPKAQAPKVAEATRAKAEQRNDVGAASSGARVMRDERVRAQSQLARTVEQSPEAELERVARLRAAGRHEEADKALAEFRKRYPDYRIAPAMLEKVEKK